MNVLYAVVVGLLTLVSHLRWLRVAQCEAYVPGRLLATGLAWMRARRVEALLLALVVLVCLASFWLPWGGVVGALLWLSWPVGMPFAGERPTRTAGAGRVATVAVALHVTATVLLALVHAVMLLPLAVVPLLEVALLLARPRVLEENAA